MYVKNDYNNCLTNLACSIRKHFGLPYHHKTLGKVDELSTQDEYLLQPYVVGEEVKVIDGPFNTFNGIIEEIDTEKKKLKITVKIFGRKTPLELGFMQVEKI